MPPLRRYPPEKMVTPNDVRLAGMPADCYQQSEIKFSLLGPLMRESNMKRAVGTLGLFLIFFGLAGAHVLKSTRHTSGAGEGACPK